MKDTPLDEGRKLDLFMKIRGLVWEFGKGEAGVTAISSQIMDLIKPHLRDGEVA